jgi:hypothetical protein
MQHFVTRQYTYVYFRWILGDVRREFMQRFSTTLHGPSGSYFRDALHEHSADAVALFLVPRD